MLLIMASPKLLRGRISNIGAIYTVTTVTHNRAPLFLRPGLAEIVCTEIDRNDNAGSTRTYAWMAMPDHVHWLLELKTGSLDNCMQRFKSRSARAINLSTGLSGAVWQAGFYDHRLRDDEDLRQQARYLVMNPIRGALVYKIEDYAFWW
ncbi:MAG: transposase [Lysobacter sp.]|nr:transposase [Lysobacter sp.]